MESGAYPAMAGLSADAFGVGWDETFEFGLHRLLDGVAALVESRRARRDVGRLTAFPPAGHCG
jgi:hypothetical protein